MTAASAANQAEWTRAALYTAIAALRNAVSGWPEALELLEGAARAARGLGKAGARLPGAWPDALLADPLLLAHAYQAWRAPEVAAVAPRVREAGAKVTGTDVVLATLLYSEPYMASFLVAHCLADGVAGDLPTVCDPSCGAGHLLLPAFDALFELRRTARPAERPEASARAVLDEQLSGLDLDGDAVEVCRRALWLRARELAPRLSGPPAMPGILACGGREAPPGEDPAVGALAVPGKGAVGGAVVAGSEGAARQLAHPLYTVLGRQHDVVLANPPYLGPKFMSPALRAHLARHFPAAGRDLFAAFIERAFALVRPGGRVGLVTPKSWLYQHAFARLRERMWREETLVAFADLGARAFAPELGLHEGVSVALTCWRHAAPDSGHVALGVRVPAAGGPEAKAIAMEQRDARVAVTQADLRAIEGAPFSYDLPAVLRERLLEGPDLRGCVKQGLATTDNARFLRYAWEVPRQDPLGRWAPCARGGPYRKWAGLDFSRVNWQADGAMIKAEIPRKYPYLGGWAWVAKNAGWYFEPGLAYGYMGYGGLGAREIEGAVFEVAAIAVFPQARGLDRDTVLAALNARTGSWILRILSRKHMFQAGMAERLPLPHFTPSQLDDVRALVRYCVQARRRLLASDPREGAHDPAMWGREPCEAIAAAAHEAAWLHAAEGVLEDLVCQGYGLDENTRRQLVTETGIPVGWLPLSRRCHKAMPGTGQLPTGRAAGPPDRPDAPAGLACDQADLAAVRANLACRQFDLPAVPADLPACVLAFLGRLDGSQMSKAPPAQPLALEGTLDSARDAPAGDAAEAIADDSPTALPHETPIEAIAAARGCHPLALLPHHPGPAERKAWLEEAAGVQVMAMLGHPWPGDPVPDARLCWPLVGPAGNALADAVRARLHPDGEVESVLGLPLARWIATRFFRQHTTAFLRRPVVWHLASRARRGREPAFACLVNGMGNGGPGAVLAPVLTELAAWRAARAADGAPAAELAELDAMTAAVERCLAAGYDTPGLADRLALEPLDAFAAPVASQPEPGNRAAWLAAERAYHPDLHDGVRVNLAPLQRAGLLHAPVLPAADVEKAIAQRAAWRAAERAWCREGLLSRPAWWDSPTEARRD